MLWLIANVIGWGLALGVFGGAVGLALYASFSFSDQINSFLQFVFAIFIFPLMGLSLGISQGVALRSKTLSPKPWILAYVLSFTIGGIAALVFMYFLDVVLSKLIGLDELFTALLVGWCIMLLTQWVLLRKSVYPTLPSLIMNSVNTLVTCIAAAIVMLPMLILAAWNLGEYWDVYWGASALDSLYLIIGFFVIWGAWGAICGFSGGLTSGIIYAVSNDF